MPQTNISIQDTRGKLMRLPEVVSIGDPGKGLNAVGVTPIDLFVILQAIKAPGVLEKESSLSGLSDRVLVN